MLNDQKLTGDSGLMEKVKNEISDTSVDIAKQVVGREIRKEDHKRLIDSFIDSL